MIVLLVITVVTCFHNTFGIDVDYLSSIDDDVPPQNITYDIQNARRIFKKFVRERNKQYKDNVEFEKRFEIFVKNLQEINEMNKRSRSEIYGITDFADITVDEFRNRYMGLANYTSDSSIRYPLRRMVYDAEAPEELDWRRNNVVTPARNQLTCNSCWAFSAVGVTEGQYAMKHRTLLSLSEQQLVDCWSPDGCDSGNFPDRALNAVNQMGGFMALSEYPYKGVRGPCAYNKERAVVKVQRGYQVSVKSEEELKNLLSQYGPLSIAIYTSKNLSAYKGRIYVPSQSECPPRAEGNHAVLLVGYGSENGTPYWIIKNSWGQNWGENGFMRMIRGQMACAITTYVAAADVL